MAKWIVAKHRGKTYLNSLLKSSPRPSFLEFCIQLTTILVILCVKRIFFFSMKLRPVFFYGIFLSVEHLKMKSNDAFFQPELGWSVWGSLGWTKTAGGLNWRMPDRLDY